VITRNSVQYPDGFWIKVTECQGLHTVRHDPNQQPARQMRGGSFPVKLAVMPSQRFEIQPSQGVKLDGQPFLLRGGAVLRLIRNLITQRAGEAALLRDLGVPFTVSGHGQAASA
jgi:hypothetical protein